jgi:two-component system alkaline phosphatase synthesis response regulator PhoP
MTTTILIVDDEKDIVKALAYNLQKHGHRVLTAHTGKDAIAEAQKAPDLILLDVMLPDIDGWDVARALKRDERTSGIPFFFVTAKGSELDEVIGFELGAIDFIRKPIGMEALLARIRSALRNRESVRRESGSAPKVLRMDGFEINVSSFSALLEGKEVSFPKKEFELLCYLAQNPGRVYSRESLLNAIWGKNTAAASRTVDVHIRKIREKLGDRSRHIVTVKRVGYRFSTEHH